MTLQQKIRIGIGAFIGIFLMMFLLGTFYTVGETERAVVLRNGALNRVENPGLHFKLPFIERVVEISVETKSTRFEKLQAYSRDQQPADFVMSVNWRIDPTKVEELYSQFRSEENFEARVLIPRTNDASKQVFGGFNAVTAIQERAKLATDIQMLVKRAMDGTPGIIESVQLENIDFSDAYEKSIEQRMLAEVEVQRIRQNAEREKVNAEITVTKATAEADSQLKRAQAQAKATELQGAADAAAIRARASALAENQNLIALTQAERWDGKLPTTMIPGGSVPMLPLR